MKSIRYFDDNRITADSSHWDYCEQNHFPYISIASYNGEYDTIFFDLTVLDRLDELSQSIKVLYVSYVDFFLIQYRDIQDCLDEHYFLYMLKNLIQSTLQKNYSNIFEIRCD